MPDREELFKGSVHYALGSLATTCLLYNALAWTTKRERRLAINVMVYAMLTALEGYQTQLHWRRLDSNKSDERG